MSEKSKGREPSRAARVFAAALAFLLTGTLWGTGLCLIGQQILTSRSLHERAALAADAREMQMERIETELRALAEEYGFSEETVRPLLQAEDVAQLDRDVIAWWTDFAATGLMGEEPAYAIQGMEEALRHDEKWVSAQNPLSMKTTIYEIENRVNKIVQRSAVLFRDLLMKAGYRMMGDRINFPQVTGLLKRAAPLMGAMSFALSGLIALVNSRRIRRAAVYLGSAVSGAGLLGLFSLLLVKGLGVGAMIREASAALAVQYAHLSRMMTGEILAGAGLMLVLGGLCIARGRKEKA